MGARPRPLLRQPPRAVGREQEAARASLAVLTAAPCYVSGRRCGIDALLDWLKDNGAALSSLGTLATLLVWLIWLQLMYNDYRSRRQPRILIHQTSGFGPDSHCLLINLSQEIVHVECVRAAAVGEEGETSLPLGSALSTPGELGPLELENVIRQGPLDQGQFLRLGSFEEILERLLDRSPEEGKEWLGAQAVNDVKTVEIRVAAVYGRSDRSVGARRRFRLESRNDWVRVKPIDTYTEQLYSRRKRKIAEGWLKQCLEE